MFVQGTRFRRTKSDRECKRCVALGTVGELRGDVQAAWERIGGGLDRMAEPGQVVIAVLCQLRLSVHPIERSDGVADGCAGARRTRGSTARH